MLQWADTMCMYPLQGMIMLAPRGSAGDMHTINLTALKPG
jgi:hypothetical protein